MNTPLAKNLTDCLITAQEIQEYLEQGRVQPCHELLQRLIERLDGCINDVLREP